MARAESKLCTVTYALPARQWSWELSMPVSATVGDALDAARAACANDARAERPQIDWDNAAVGVFGRIVSREVVFAEGDRIEIYRPLEADPRVRRRARVAQARRSARRR